jgi:hypothetical protein
MCNRESSMRKYHVHQHHHYGWTTNVLEAETAHDAMTADIMKSHPWLADYEHALVFKDGRYSVTYEGATPRPIFGGEQVKGDHWFADQIHVGEADDCTACGGTGINHYYSWCQCWQCGETDPRSALFYKKGRSSGKRMVAEPA